jgi:hypothetical protein
MDKVVTMAAAPAKRPPRKHTRKPAAERARTGRPLGATDSSPRATKVPSLERAIKAAVAGGLTVGRVSVDKSGAFELVFGVPGETAKQPGGSGWEKPLDE